jgi:hypothetical protein
MKKKIFLSFVIVYAFITISFITKSQNIKIDFNSDAINLVEFDLVPDRIDYLFSSNTISLSESDFLSRFINPISISNEYREMDEDISIVYKYNGAEAWFYKQKLDALIFTNSDYKFILTNGTSIKVGDNISLVAQNFPNSWESVEEYSEHQVIIELKGPNGPLDSVIVFEFEINTGTITKIVFNTID